MLCKPDRFKNTLINTNAHNCTYYLKQNRKQAKYVCVTYEHLSLCTFNTIKYGRNRKHKINYYLLLENLKKVPLSQTIIPRSIENQRNFHEKNAKKTFSTHKFSSQR